MQKVGKGPKGFIVVLPGGIIEIPQDSYLSWLTLFYLMPRVLVEKWPPALEIPRRPFEALRSQKCLDSIKQDKFAELIWDCWSWSAWQFFQVKDSRGNYRDIPGSRDQYSGHFPLWKLSYDILRYFRHKIEHEYISFQALYIALPEDEMPWFAYQQFCNLVGNMTDLVVKEQNMQPTIDAIWENRTIEDYEAKNSTVRNDFLRHWNHGPSGKTVSYEGMVEEGGDIMDVDDPRADFENKVLSEGKVKAFKSRLTEKDSEILRLRMEGHTEQEIADAVGIKTASAVHKRIAKLAEAYDDFVTKEYQNNLG